MKMQIDPDRKETESAAICTQREWLMSSPLADMPLQKSKARS